MYVCRHISFTRQGVIPFLTLLEESGCKSEFLSLSTISPGCAVPNPPADSLQWVEQGQKAKTNGVAQAYLFVNLQITFIVRTTGSGTVHMHDNVV